MSDVVIASVGAQTPLGLNARQTGFLLRAGLPAMAEAPLANRDDEPITMAFLPTIDPLLVGAERLVALARPAFEEAVAALPGAKAAVHMVLDEGSAHQHRVTGPLERMVSSALPSGTLHLHLGGEAAPGVFLPKALAALKSRALDAVVVGGLHTDFEPEVIQGLEASGRLFARDNLDAVIPGECAAFVVLMREPDAARYELPALARLRGIGDGRDGVRIDNTASAYEAFGLAAAARAATKSLGESEQTAGWVLTDLTHEMWRQKEWQSVFVRLQRVLGNPYYIDSPAQRMGQLGGAALPLLMTIAATAWQYDYAPSPRAILLGTSKGGGRAALTLENMMSRAEEITP